MNLKSALGCWRSVKFNRSASGWGPRTIVGRWFLASLFESETEMNRYRNMLNRGVGGYNNDEPAVLDLVCIAIVRRYFGDVIDPRRIDSFAADLSGRVRGAEPPIQVEVEALVYLALGDRDSLPVVRKMSRSDIFHTQASISARIAFELELSRDEVMDIIVNAEGRALEQGWKPPLLP